jgi:hypothetical protein
VEVTYESDYPFNARVTIISLGGKLVTASTESIFRGTNMFYYDLSAVPSGMYFVRLEDQSTGTAEVAKLSIVR